MHLHCPICDFSTNSMGELQWHMQTPSRCHALVEKRREQQDVRDRERHPPRETPAPNLPTE
jgi:hypothetical protein